MRSALLGAAVVAAALGGNARALGLGSEGLEIDRPTHAGGVVSSIPGFGRGAARAEGFFDGPGTAVTMLVGVGAVSGGAAGSVVFSPLGFTIDAAGATRSATPFDQSRVSTVAPDGLAERLISSALASDLWHTPRASTTPARSSVVTPERARDAGFGAAEFPSRVDDAAPERSNDDPASRMEFERMGVAPSAGSLVLLAAGGLVAGLARRRG